nr:hypothetical protein [Tanacetum cinerariifolium]
SIDKSLNDKVLREKESACLGEYVEAMKEEEQLMYQKAKIKWMSFGDRNNALFHKVLKSRMNRNIINYVRDCEEAYFLIRDVEDDEIKDAMFQIDGNKAPDPDGYSSHFFKKTW